MGRDPAVGVPERVEAPRRHTWALQLVEATLTAAPTETGDGGTDCTRLVKWELHRHNSAPKKMRYHHTINTQQVVKPDRLLQKMH